MLTRPPVHRVDATPVLVLWGEAPLHDDAWDMSRIEAERAEIELLNKERKKGDRINLADHPVHVYTRGQTRLDIEAPLPWRGRHVAASEYLRDDVEPTRFVLRRLPWERYYEVLASQARNVVAGNVAACRLGLADVQNLEGVEVDSDLPERSYDEMAELFAIDPNLPMVIGAMVIAASQPLTPREKKA